MSDVLAVLGIAFLIISAIISVFHVGERALYSYERCYVCDGLPCDCKYKVVYQDNAFQEIFLILGCSLFVVLLIVKVIQDE